MTFPLEIITKFDIYKSFTGLCDNFPDLVKMVIGPWLPVDLQVVDF